MDCHCRAAWAIGVCFAAIGRDRREARVGIKVATIALVALIIRVAASRNSLDACVRQCIADIAFAGTVGVCHAARYADRYACVLTQVAQFALAALGVRVAAGAPRRSDARVVNKIANLALWTVNVAGARWVITAVVGTHGRI